MVEVRGVEVVHSGFERRAEHPFRFFEVDLRTARVESRQTHHPEAQQRQRETGPPIAAARYLPALDKIGAFVAVRARFAGKARQGSQCRQGECALQKITSVHLSALPHVLFEIYAG